MRKYILEENNKMFIYDKDKNHLRIIYEQKDYCEDIINPSQKLIYKILEKGWTLNEKTR